LIKRNYETKTRSFGRKTLIENFEKKKKTTKLSATISLAALFLFLSTVFIYTVVRLIYCPYYASKGRFYTPGRNSPEFFLFLPQPSATVFY